MGRLFGHEDHPPQFSLRSYFKFRDCMTDAAKLVKKLDFIKRKAVAHLRDAKACVVACERIILQLRRKEAIGQLRSDDRLNVVKKPGSRLRNTQHSEQA